MKTLIILHGWQSSKERWQAVKQEIEERTENGSRCIRVVAPDLPGFKKETELSRVWDLDDYVEWFKDFSSKVCEDPAEGACPEPAEGFFLLGHSFGGRIAIKFAQKYPEKLKGLILVSAAGIKHKRTPYIRLILDIAKIGRRFSFLSFYPFFRNFFYKYILRKTDYLKAEKFSYLKETFKKIIAEDLTSCLPQIKTPTLIIWGEKDKLTPLSDAYLMKKEIPNSKLEILKGVGHFPHSKNPEILVQKIKSFVEVGLPTGSPPS